MTATLNASTSSGVILTSDTSGTLAFQSNGSTIASVGSSGMTINSYVAGASTLTNGTAVTLTNQTSVDFNVPTWAKKITVMMDNVKNAGGALFLVQLGTTSSIETTGYNSGGGLLLGTSGAAAYGTFSTAGFVYLSNSATAGSGFSGFTTVALLNPASNTWACSGTLTNSASTYAIYVAGSKSLASALTTVRFTSVGGTDTYTAGQINILYE
jgi:hypothetical protein